MSENGPEQDTCELIPFPGTSEPGREVTAQPNPRVIAALEHYLDAAKKGDIQAIVMAAVMPCMGYRGMSSPSNADTKLRNAMTTSLSVMQRRVLDEVMEDLDSGTVPAPSA